MNHYGDREREVEKVRYGKWVMYVNEMKSSKMNHIYLIMKKENGVIRTMIRWDKSLERLFRILVVKRKNSNEKFHFYFSVAAAQRFLNEDAISVKGHQNTLTLISTAIFTEIEQVDARSIPSYSERARCIKYSHKYRKWSPCVGTRHASTPKCMNKLKEKRPHRMSWRHTGTAVAEKNKRPI